MFETNDFGYLLPLPSSAVSSKSTDKSYRRIFGTWPNYPDLVQLLKDKKNETIEKKDKATNLPTPTTDADPTNLPTPTTDANLLTSDLPLTCSSVYPDPSNPKVPHDYTGDSPTTFDLDLSPDRHFLWADYFSRIPGLKGAIVAFEISDSGLHHLQYCLFFSSQKTFKSLRRVSYRTHLEEIRDQRKAINYCRKGSNYFILGDLPNFNDSSAKSESYADLVKDILDGVSTRKLALDYPQLVLRHSRGIDDLRKAVQREDYIEAKRIQDAIDAGERIEIRDEEANYLDDHPESSIFWPDDQKDWPKK